MKSAVISVNMLFSMLSLRLCSTFSYAPIKLFLSGSPEDERLFEILLKSYSGARYKSNFLVLADDAQVLYSKTVVFVALAKQMCNEKIARFEQQAMLYKKATSEQYQ